MPPLAEPSSLVSTTPVTSVASPNSRAWVEAVLAGGGVDHEQRLGDLAGALLGDAAHLAQLVHQVRLGVQPAGGVGHARDRCSRRGPLDAVEDHRARVAALGPADDLDARALGPRRELLGGGGAERVAGGEQHERPSSTCWLASLPIVVVLPTPLTPTNIHTFGFPAQRLEVQRAVGTVETAVHLGLQAVEKLLGLGDLLGLHLLRRPPSRSSVTPTPTSARSSASSRSSKLSSVMPERPSTPAIAPANVERALASRSERRRCATTARARPPAAPRRACRPAVGWGRPAADRAAAAPPQRSRRRLTTTTADPEGDDQHRQDQKDHFETHDRRTLSPPTRARTPSPRPGSAGRAAEGGCAE